MALLENIREQITVLEVDLSAVKELLRLKELEKQAKEKRLFELRTMALYIEEIYRLAAIQFPRLQNRMGLTDQDRSELEKLIGRAKSSEGLKNIIEALNELAKYKPQDIKVNLYGLLQKIIIGGAYNQKRV